MDEFPAWITAPGGQRLVVMSEAEKEAVMEGRAVLSMTHSAEEDVWAIQSVTPKATETQEE